MKMREPQYERLLEVEQAHGRAKLGLMTNQVWHDDPKRLAFVLSRYKFAAKMLAGRDRVLEVGCGDAFGTRIVQQEVGHVSAIDFDLAFIADAQARWSSAWPFTVFQHDAALAVPRGTYDGIFALDVIEHIERDKEVRFMQNLCDCLEPTGIMILGSPSVESQRYASTQSREGHVNCKHGLELRELMGRFFHTTFLFSMNDEVVHTGFLPMAHYLLAIGCHKK